jgi:hypothetical protein
MAAARREAGERDMSIRTASVGLFLLLGACGAERGGDPDPPPERPERADVREDRPPARPGSETETNLGAGKPEGGELASSRAPAAQGVTREWFVGAWTDTEDCGDAADFARDGRYRLADGTRGMWNVTDGRLVVQGAAGRNVVRLRRVDDDIVEVINEDGSVGRSRRC